MTIRVTLTEAEIRAAIVDWLENTAEHIQNACESGVVRIERSPTTGEYIAHVDYTEMPL